MKISKITENIKESLSSKYFLGLLLTLVFAQGFWYAFSFQPSIFDEARHLGFIELYTSRFNPFIAVQETSVDWLGDVTREPSYLYYYLMSYPFRLAAVFTDNYKFQVIFLRLLHTLFFAIAIYLYDKYFKIIGIPAALSRVALLFLLLTPAISILPGAVNYDNLIFLFSSLILLKTAQITRQTQFRFEDLLVFANLILLGVLIKYTFFALAVPLLLIICSHIVRTKNDSSMLQKKKLPVLIPLAAGTIFLLGLVIDRPIRNLIEYNTFSSNCIILHGRERCLQNYVQKRNIDALDNKLENFSPSSLYKYTVKDWVPSIVKTQVRLNPWEAPYKALLAIYYAGFLGGVILILIYIQRIWEERNLQLILILTIFFTCTLLVNNYLAYRKLAEVVAASSRYLLPVQPLFMVLVGMCMWWLVRKRNTFLVIATIGLLGVYLLFGGGVHTYRNMAPPELRWQE